MSSTPDVPTPPSGLRASGEPGGDAAVPLYGPEFAAAPGRVYARLRAVGPVCRVELAPGVRATLVTGYAEALDVLRRPARFARDPRRWQPRVAPDSPVLPVMGYRPNSACADGATHARIRGAVSESLARLEPMGLRNYVEAVADQLIDEFAGVGTADLVAQYAGPLPAYVLNRLLGCPEALGQRLVDDVRAMAHGLSAEEASADLAQCLARVVASKRAHPMADMTSWLVTHRARLTNVEAVHEITLLLSAGTQWQQNLIANGLRLLLSDGRFAGDLSGGSLPVEDALDEILWTDPPVANLGITYPTEDVELAGVHCPKDEPVVISFAAANTDPALRSEQRAGNRAHLAFGAGPHACPAQRQARVIASVAVERLLDRVPDLALAVPASQLTWQPGPFLRALTALPVRFPAAHRMAE